MRGLRAGPLSLLLDDRDIRRVRWQEVELIRRIGVAVRDPQWRTVPACSGDAEVVRDDGDRIAIRVSARHAGEELDVSWEGVIEAGADDGLRYSITWRAQHDADYNRIGLVVLLPPQTMCGRPCMIHGPESDMRLMLPDDIAPQPFAYGRYHAMMPAFSSFSAWLPVGTVRCSFTGDLFEIEDQRNWADDSFKVYGTPLSTPLPQHARPSEPVRQAVHVTFAPAPDHPHTRACARARDAGPTALRIGAETGGRVPALGLTLPIDAPEPGPAILMGLRRIGPGHLRHDVHTGRPDWERALRAAIGACAEVECGLELAVHADDPADLAAVHDATRGAPLVRVLVFGSARDPSHPSCCTRQPLAAAARRLVCPGIPLAGGTDLAYADLNRWRPDTADLDEIAYTVSVQVHERDDMTVVENLQGIAATVTSARRAFSPLPIVVGRVSLREGEPDERLGTAFGAAWGLAAAIELLRAGAAAATTFATHGASGVLGDDGEPRPLGDALAALAQLQGARLRELEGVPAPLGGLAAEAADGPTVLLANPGPEDVELTIMAVDDGRPVPVRVPPRSWRRLAAADLSSTASPPASGPAER